MANASAKKTAANNEQAIHNLRQGLLLATTLSMLIRLIFRAKSLSPAQLSFWIHILSHIPSTFIARYLSKIGEPKRSPSGELISPGEDLNQPGVIEWAFDVIYVTCKRVHDSPIVVSQTVHNRGVSSWKCNIRGKVLVVRRGRESYPTPLTPPSKFQSTRHRSRYMRFTKSGRRSSGHTSASENPLIQPMPQKKQHLSKRANDRRSSRSAANGETLVSRRRPSKNNSRQ